MGLKKEMKENVGVTLGGPAGGFGHKHNNEMKIF